MEFPASPNPDLGLQQAIEEQPPANDGDGGSDGPSPSILRAKTLELGAEILPESDGEKVGVPKQHLLVLRYQGLIPTHMYCFKKY